MHGNGTPRFCLRTFLKASRSKKMPIFFVLHLRFEVCFTSTIRETPAKRRLAHQALRETEGREPCAKRACESRHGSQSLGSTTALRQVSNLSFPLVQDEYRVIRTLTWPGGSQSARHLASIRVGAENRWLSSQWFDRSTNHGLDSQISDP